MNVQQGKKIYGLIGYPVKHSLSPLMHNAAFKELGIDAEYRLFEIAAGDLERFLLKNIPVKDSKGESFDSQHIAGFNITVPYKIKAAGILKKNYCAVREAMTPVDWYYLELTGAVNTVKRQGDELLYWNTDAGGFFRSLFEDLKFKNTQGRSVLLIGCGGAGRAVIAALSWEGLGVEKIYIYDNNPEVVNLAGQHFFGLPQGDSLKKKLEFIPREKIIQIIKNCHLLVNASGVGMKDDEGSVIDKELLKQNKQLSVYDLVYNRRTQLIKDAGELGYPAAGGEGMLLYQGVYAFKYWTGQWPKVDTMRRALEEGVKKI